MLGCQSATDWGGSAPMTLAVVGASGLPQRHYCHFLRILYACVLQRHTMQLQYVASHLHVCRRRRTCGGLEYYWNKVPTT
jgi:hypothetical protein